jgi:hypothetical protein
MAALIYLVSLSMSILVLSRISCIALGSDLLEDKQKFKLGDVLALKKH